jgi:putative nucleotidyltransferase with HDIG domain
MSSTKDSDQNAYFATPEQLRIGLYVFIDLPWFQHPFTLNSFKISSAKQIQQLMTLGEARFRFDPARSSGVVEESQPNTTTKTAPSAQPPTDGAPGNAAPRDLAMAEKKARIERLIAQNKAVANMEKSFAKASSVMRGLNKNLMSHPKETLEEMGGMVDQMVSVFLEHPEVTLQVLSEKAGSEEIYYHGLNVSVLCLMLAKELHIKPEQARLLGTGALLHDIGLTEIPDRVLRKPPGDYTNAERELRAMHVEYGLTLGKRLGLPPEVMTIIGQHHELADGTGYPKHAKLEQIAPLARIVALVNFYDNLCNPLEASHAMTPHEALSFMFAQRRAKFDATVLQVLVRSLGVYPPGSIVKLSNDAVAMVVSVNPKKSLRPWVLLYDPLIPKDQAIMLDLEMETELNIQHAIRPALLHPMAYAYLCPRKRVTYFFDGQHSHEKVKS